VRKRNIGAAIFFKPDREFETGEDVLTGGVWMFVQKKMD
jgi:hypothetical protein